MKSNKIDLKSVREEVPLLPQNSDSTSSDAVQVFHAHGQSNITTASTQQRKPKGLRRLFSPTKKVPITYAATRNSTKMDTRPILPETKPQEVVSRPRESRTTVPPLLEQPKTDTSKKARPFPVPSRRRKNVASRADPPIDSARSTKVDPRPGTAPAADDEKKSDDEEISYAQYTDRELNKKTFGLTVSEDPNRVNLEVLDESDSLSSNTHGEFALKVKGIDSLPESLHESTLDSYNTATTGQSHSIQFFTRELQLQAILNRPFGRDHLPLDISRKFVADVSQAEWDAEEQKWKYRILLQKRNLEDQPLVDAAQSFTTAFTWRTHSDFKWLEQALQIEFHGGLLIPDLNIALGISPDSNFEGMPVEAEKLRHWLNDVLNGIRGQGELVLVHEKVDLLRSDAMEEFLYKHTGNLGKEDEGLGSEGHKKDLKEEESFLQALWNRPLSIVPLEFCVGPEPDRIDTPTRRPQLGFGARSSRIIGNSLSLDIQESFVVVQNDQATPVSTLSGRPSNVLVAHSALLEAESELVHSYRKTTLGIMEKLQSLKEDEAQIGRKWKHFGSSLSNLFAYEKDVENARLCDVKILREDIPYRNVSKTKVSEGLRLLAKQKNDRAVPALDGLNEMLAAYVADLSAVKPAMDAYNRAATKLSLLSGSKYDVNNSSEEYMHTRPPRKTNRATIDVKQNEVCVSLERSFKMNERLLEKSLTELCRGVLVRTSRMIWRLWSTEANACVLLNKAATLLKSITDVTNKEAIAKMIKRHLKEDKEDKSTELDLISRIVAIRTIQSRLTKPSGSFPEDEKTAQDDTAFTQKRELVLQLARERIGRWDANLSRNIMEAVQVKDPHVRVEETTRELRLVRKYAIGLREHLARCIETIQQLRTIHTTTVSANAYFDRNTGKIAKHISQKRCEFVSELSNLLSGKLLNEKGNGKRSSPSLAILASAGIDTSDPLGWSDRNGKDAPFSNAKEYVEKYTKERDSQMDWLITSLHDLLMDYHHRVESIEGFVYMECVGIQLEKHFSQLRAQALEAYEKKTDLTTALTAVTRKGHSRLIQELQEKVDRLGPDVSHTLVKETKDMHLEAKSLKSELHDLAIRRLTRARETSTERIVTLISLWAREEERATACELSSLKMAMEALQKGLEALPVETIVYRT